MTNGFSEGAFDACGSSLKRALFGDKMEYGIKSAEMNMPGKVRGKLGRNLTLVQACLAAKSE